MYYDGKSSFYVKQYGPIAILTVLSFLLIGTGLYVYLTSSASNSAPKEIVVASDNLQEDNKQQENKTETENKNAEQNTVKKPVIEEVLIPSVFESMDILLKTPNVKIESIDSSGDITVTFDNKKFKIYLIGIDYSNAKATIIDRITQDLKGKEVKLAFDNQKVVNSKVAAYIYIDTDSLYNATLLEDGEASLKQESANTSLLNELKQSQTYARQLKAGIWENK